MTVEGLGNVVAALASPRTRNQVPEKTSTFPYPPLGLGRATLPPRARSHVLSSLRIHLYLPISHDPNPRLPLRQVVPHHRQSAGFGLPVPLRPCPRRRR